VTFSLNSKESWHTFWFTSQQPQKFITVTFRLENKPIASLQPWVGLPKGVVVFWEWTIPHKKFSYSGYIKQFHITRQFKPAEGTEKEEVGLRGYVNMITVLSILEINLENIKAATHKLSGTDTYIRNTGSMGLQMQDERFRRVLRYLIFL
jgi:hypothetical protein